MRIIGLILLLRLTGNTDFNRCIVIYTGKVSDIDCFRIANIGCLFECDIHSLLAAIRTTLSEMRIELPRD